MCVTSPQQKSLTHDKSLAYNTPNNLNVDDYPSVPIKDMDNGENMLEKQKGVP